VLGFRPGDPVDRRVRAILLDAATGAAADVVASLSRGAVDSYVVLDTARDGQPPIMLEDLEAVEEVVNPTKTNRLGQPVAYALYPQGTPLLAADAGAAITRRAVFATKDLWVTRYDPAQRYAGLPR
jgi:Cu2+-containing amine oxidase